MNAEERFIVGAGVLFMVHIAVNVVLVLQGSGEWIGLVAGPFGAVGIAWGVLCGRAARLGG